MHKLLKRQLERAFGDSIPETPAFRVFLESVDAAYLAADEDHALLGRSLELASRSLLEKNRGLREAKELAERAREDAERARERAERASSDKSLHLGDLENLVKKRTDALGTITDIARALSSTLSLEKLLDIIAGQTARVMNAENLYVAIAHPDSAEIEFVLDTRPGFPRSGRRRGECNSLTEYVIRTRMPLFVRGDVAKRLDELGIQPVGTVTASWIGVPLAIGDRVLGVLAVQHETDPDAHDEGDVELLVSIANQLAIAFENARLFESVLAARAEAEEANKLKSQFLTSISHELRTPLNSIINFAYILETETSLPAEQGELLLRIEESGRHLLGLINNILDIAKIEAGRMELSYEDTRLEDILDTALSNAAILLHGKPIELRHEYQQDLPAMRIDRLRVRQVLLNLLSNAVKFTESGHITLRAVATGDTATVSVEDSGIGIPREDLPKAFMEFVQLDGSMTRRAGGTGLGLAISKRIIELHGGRIWAESEPGIGSTFHFSLPLMPSLKACEDSDTTGQA